jgi:hypothetical protein
LPTPLEDHVLSGLVYLLLAFLLSVFARRLEARLRVDR